MLVSVGGHWAPLSRHARRTEDPRDMTDTAPKFGIDLTRCPGRVFRQSHVQNRHAGQLTEGEVEAPVEPRGPRPVIGPGTSPAACIARRNSCGLMNVAGSWVPDGSSPSRSSAAVIVAKRAIGLRLMVSKKILRRGAARWQPRPELVRDP
jgi:hypothetical protein